MPIKVISLSEQEVASVEDVAALQQQLASLESRVAYLESKPPVDPLPDPDPDPDPVEPPDPPQPPANNIDALIAAGYPMPPAADWLTPTPAPAAIKAMLRAPHPPSQGVRRLLVPADLSQMDQVVVDQMAGGGHGPQQWALYGLRERSAGNDSTADTAMANARAGHRTVPYPGLPIYGGGDVAVEFAKLFCLDWTEWEDAATYEVEFAAVKQAIEDRIAAQIASRNWHEEGHSDPNHWGGTAFVMLTLLALHAHGANPSGASHAWADGFIELIGQDQGVEGNPWDPWSAARMLSLIGRTGGGEEYGWGSNTFYGPLGYESYYTASAPILLGAVDTACGTNLRNTLYSQTRHLSLAAELTPDTTYNNSWAGAMSAHARMLGGDVGGNWVWLRNQQGSGNGTQNWRELQACLGPEPAEVEPDWFPFTGRLGSYFFHRAEAAPESFRFRIVCRNLENYRFAPEEGVFSFMIGSLGLTDLRCNRGAESGAQSNGFWFGQAESGGGPKHITPGLDRQECSIHQWSHTKALWPEKLLEDPAHLVGDASSPVLNGAVWEWSYSLAGRIGEGGSSQGAGVVGPCSKSMLFDPSLRRLEMTDTLSVDSSYLGWHFSPTHQPTWLADGFEITDGTNTIRVTIQSEDAGVGLVRTERASWSIDGVWAPLDYHGRDIPMNVGYTPDSRIATHNIKTIVEVL